MSGKKGVVVWYNGAKGYGFLRPDGSKSDNGRGEDFVHASAVERAGLDTLHQGDRVSYEMIMGKNGKAAAANLKLLNE